MNEGQSAVTIKVILAPVSATAAGESALATAFALGRRFDAHVAALHVRPDPRYAMPYIGEGTSGVVVHEIMLATERDAEERAANARALFDRLCEEHGVPVMETPPAGLSASWADETGREDEAVASLGRLADVVVVAGWREEPGSPPAAMTLEAALLGSGRPVLLAPPGGVRSLGACVAVAWNGSAEASRAVGSAIPVLRGADKVAVLTAGEGEEALAVADGLVRYLAWHGIGAFAEVLSPGPAGTGARLLEEVERVGADLLVMGAYTHNRFRQMIFGGVTRHVLAHAGLPVLVAH